MSGPLTGVRVVEMAGIGPAPFAAMLLADMGADVVRIDRPSASDLGIAMPARFDTFNRNKRSISIDLKHPRGVDAALALIARADILVEGFRPGVMERLGLSPDECMTTNRRLVFGRMTGWGQEGPLAQTAGHDLNYVALTGALDAIGPRGGAPIPPLNLVGDLGGGALYLAMGVLAAYIEAQRTGRGQIVDAAMVDGVASMMSMFLALRQMGAWTLERGANLLDGGAPFYGVYETSDSRHVAVAAIEARFYRELVHRMGIAADELPPQNKREFWPATKARFQQVFKSRSRDEWTAVMEDADACFAPVLTMDEAVAHPLSRAREIYQELDGVLQPAPAPRFSRTSCDLRTSAPEIGQHSAEIMRDWAIPEELAKQFVQGAVVSSTP